MKITITQAELATVLKDYYSLESAPEVEVVPVLKSEPKSKRGVISRGWYKIIYQPHMSLNQASWATGGRFALRLVTGTEWSCYGGAGGGGVVCTEAQAVAWVEDGVLPQK